MKAIILAAGEGTRLRPYTLEKPKCMVEYNNKPIINYIIDTMKACKLTDISIIGGYKYNILHNHLKNESITFHINENYHKTNMVYTLFSSPISYDKDLIISYADIIYKKEVLQALINTQSNISIIIDKDWKTQWQLRMENPLIDAETLKLDKDNNIIELGKKPKNYKDIEGQYIGLIKISKNTLKIIHEYYLNLDKTILYDNKDYNNIYMTSFLQLIIDNISPIKAININGGWFEIDSVKDLEVLNSIKFFQP